MGKFISNNGKYLTGKKKAVPGKKAKRKGRVILTVVLSLVLVMSLAVGGVAVYWNHLLGYIGDETETIPTLSQEELLALLGNTEPAYEPTEQEENQVETTVETTPEDTWPVIVSDKNITNIMLVGQNFRPDEAHRLADTMILCSINRETKTLTMVSFLRDLYVTIPPYAGHGYGGNRINVCYALGSSWTGKVEGGMELLAKTVEHNFGIPIHHSVEIDFESFVEIIDAIGGVEIELSEAEARHMTEDLDNVGTFEPGLQILDGETALHYSRIRKIDSDIERTNRQRKVITSIVDQCRTMGLMDLHKLATTVLPMIKTDMTNAEITNYVWEFLPMLKDLQIVSERCPVDNDILPGSSWPETIDLGGSPASVIKSNAWLNRKYLIETLGLKEAEE